MCIDNYIFVLFFLLSFFAYSFLYQIIQSKTNNLHTVIWFQVSNTNNYIDPSNYFYLKMIISLYSYMVSSKW